MRRREFITLLGGAAAWPLAARAQQPAMPVIGFLADGFSAPNSGMVDAFRRGLAEAGYVDVQNVMIEFTGPAANLVRRQAAVIVATQPRLAIAAQAATSTIPIVFVIGEDPVKYGLVASFNRPGGNVTGISLLSAGLGGKRLDLLLELIPQATTVAFLSGPSDLLVFEDQMSYILAAGRALGRQIVVLEAPRDFEAAFATVVERRAGALIVGNVQLFVRNRDKIVALAARYKIPTIYPNRLYVVGGGLMSYDADRVGVYHQLGVQYVGRLLKGAKPADLPVQQPTKFELVINLKTAKALGLEIPRTLLVQAEQVLE